jgi:sucrose-6-phosphate hydrolase SacC (GH32 family)
MRFIFIFWLNLCVFSTVFGQVYWQKYANNPVLVKGSSNWDIIAIGQPTCLIENDTIKMWYAAVGNDMKARICYAFSLDGIHWTRYNNGTPVLDVGTGNAWDKGWLDTPEIVRGNNGYHLYYYGDTIQQSPWKSAAIGVAHSPDGIHWTKDPLNPIFTKGNTGQWDQTWVESPAVLYDNTSGEYKMWYNGVDTANWRIHIGLATSNDGIHWTRYPGNPILSAGNWGSYDDMWLGTPAVIYKGGKYEMWYSSTSTRSYNPPLSKFDTINICYATSTNGINWIKFPGNPLFNTYTALYDTLIDTDGPWAPDVVFNNKTNKYQLWFECLGGFSYATAPDSIAGIKELLTIYPITLYPNPSSGEFIIDFPESDDIISISVFDIMGKSLQPLKYFESPGKIRLDMSDHSNGIYFIRIFMAGEVYHAKVLKE